MGKFYTVFNNNFHVYNWRSLGAYGEEKAEDCGWSERLDQDELVVLLEYVELPDGYRAKFLRGDGTVKYLRDFTGGYGSAPFSSLFKEWLCSKVE